MLRFRKEDGSEYKDYKTATIGGVCDVMKGAPLSKADITDEGAPFILYGELYTTYNEVVRNVVRKTDRKVDDKYYSTGGEVIIPTSGESAEEISKAACVVPKGVILAGDLNIYRSRQLNGEYFSYLVNHGIKYDIARIAQGAAIIHTSAHEIKKIKIHIPELEEQEKIAQFMSSVDEVIADYEAKVKNLQNQKKGVMQKLFSQEVRFKADDGSEFPEWVKMKFEEFCVINPKPDEIDEIIYYIDLESVNDGLLTLKPSIEKEKAPSRAQRTLNKGDVLFQTVRPYQKNHYYFKEEFELQTVASTGYAQLRAKEGCNAFLYQMLYEATFGGIVDKYCTGSNYPAITPSDLGTIRIKVPCIEEQQKIADCLTAFDNAIEDLQQTVQHWKNIKKGLLQQLFDWEGIYN